MTAKKLLIYTVLSLVSYSGFSQSGKDAREERREERKERINAMIRQEEEGVLVYNRQTVFGVQLKSNGYGAFLELGRMKDRYKSNIYQIEIAEIKHPKELKKVLTFGSGIFSSNPFIYGKENYFYTVRLGTGQSRRIGDKGNKNGVSIQAVYLGGLSLGLQRPYYVQVQDPVTQDIREIKYGSGIASDSSLFEFGQITGGTGLRRGWNEIKINPGAYGKLGLRFDYGRFNESVSAVEIGLSAEFFSKKIPMMIRNDQKQFFFNAYFAIEFGRRR
jgi:hypothetical protein